MQLTILGTSCMMPTKKRNHAAFFLRFNNYGLLFDCGEGTQRQFKFAKIKPTKVDYILLTHWHGDHALGLPGLLQTLTASSYTKKLTIIGPKGTKQRYEHMYKAYTFDNRLNIEIKEITKAGKIADEKDFYLEAYPMKHAIPNVGYRFVEKDRRKVQMDKLKKMGLSSGPLVGKIQNRQNIKHKGKIIKADTVTKIVKGKIFAYVTDTLLNDNCAKAAKNADLFVCEATYANDWADKAKEFKHLTGEQAAKIAKKAKVKQLLLTHFSTRYKQPKEILQEAKKVFKNTQAAEDFMVVDIT